MKSRPVKSCDGREWKLGENLGELKSHLAAMRPAIEQSLRARAHAYGTTPRVRVLYLGTTPKYAVTPQAYTDWNKTLYCDRDDFLPAYQPYFILLEELGWEVEGRWDSGTPRDGGLYLYVIASQSTP